MNGLTPIDGGKRIVLLDSLRGFALLGIMFVNMTWFTGFAVLSADEKYALGTANIDSITYWLIQVLVDGKFWSMFALLFGIGIAIQQTRASHRNVAFYPVYVRRLSVLLVIGLAHAIFLWFGDIVSLYAVAGFALLLFRKTSNRGMLVWAIILLALPVVQLGVWLIAYLIQNPAQSVDPGYGPTALIPVFGSGSYAEILQANWAFLQERWVIAIYDGRFYKLAGMFLLGLWAGRMSVLQRPELHQWLLKRWLVMGLALGLVLNAVAVSAFPDVSLRPPSFAGWIVGVLKAVGVPALCLAYVAGFTLLFQAVRNSRLMTWFALTGRLSLTNYILQSVVGIGLFYGCGLGLWGSIGVTWSIAVILAIFAVQVGASRIWLGQFQYGPVEWAWRCLTYGRLLPLRRTDQQRQPIASEPAPGVER